MSKYDTILSIDWASVKYWAPFHEIKGSLSSLTENITTFEELGKKFNLSDLDLPIVIHTSS